MFDDEGENDSLIYLRQVGREQVCGNTVGNHFYSAYACDNCARYELVKKVSKLLKSIGIP